MQNLEFLLQSKTRLGGYPIGRTCSVRTNGNSLKMFLSTSYLLHRLVVSSWLVERRIPIIKERTSVSFKSTLTASRVGRITSKVLQLLPVKVGWFQKNFGWIHKQFRKTSRLTTRLYFKVIKCSGACRQTILMDKRTPAGPPCVRGPAWVQDLTFKTASVDGRSILRFWIGLSSWIVFVHDFYSYSDFFCNPVRRDI